MLKPSYVLFGGFFFFLLLNYKKLDFMLYSLSAWYNFCLSGYTFFLVRDNTVITQDNV